MQVWHRSRPRGTKVLLRYVAVSYRAETQRFRKRVESACLDSRTSRTVKKGQSVPLLELRDFRFQGRREAGVERIGPVEGLASGFI